MVIDNLDLYIHNMDATTFDKLINNDDSDYEFPSTMTFESDTKND